MPRGVARAARWSGLDDRAQVALLDALREALEARFPGGPRTRVDRARRWGIVELAGPGKRRLPGMRRDAREHVVRAASDGRFLQASYALDGELRDSLSLAAPTTRSIPEVVAFFERHATRIWWKAAGAPVLPGPGRKAAKRATDAARRKAPAASKVARTKPRRPPRAR